MRASLLAIPVLLIAVATAENEVGFCDNLGSGSQTVGVNWRGVAGAIISVIPIEGNAFALLEIHAHNLITKISRFKNKP